MLTVALLIQAAPALAGTFVTISCSCDPVTSGVKINYDGATDVGCVCKNTYTLGKLSTKEFRFYCTNENARTIPLIGISDRDSPTTCTVHDEDPGFYDYTTQSCTNWSTLSTDQLTLETVCWRK